MGLLATAAVADMPVGARLLPSPLPWSRAPEGMRTSEALALEARPKPALPVKSHRADNHDETGGPCPGAIVSTNPTTARRFPQAARAELPCFLYPLQDYAHSL